MEQLCKNKIIGANGTNGQLFIGAIVGANHRQCRHLNGTIVDSDSCAQWRWRQWDMLGANGAIAICAIDDGAICAIRTIGANGDSANGSNF